MVFDRNYRLNKAEGSFILAQKYYTKARRTNIIHSFWYGKSYKIKSLDAARQYSNLALKNFKLIDENARFLQVLKFKSAIEKILEHDDYFDTMIALGDYYSTNQTANIQILTYYNNAFFYALDKRSGQVDDKIILLALLIIDKYQGLLSFVECKRIYKLMIHHYFNMDDYQNAYDICNQFAEYLLSKKIHDNLTNKIFFWTILAELGKNKLELARKKFKYYCKYSNVFKNSSIGQFISEILLLAKDKNISLINCPISEILLLAKDKNANDFSISISEFNEIYHFRNFEIKILINLFLA